MMMRRMARFFMIAIVTSFFRIARLNLDHQSGAYRPCGIMDTGNPFLGRLCNYLQRRSSQDRRFEDMPEWQL
jgi:hypothetical protein